VKIFALIEHEQATGSASLSRFESMLKARGFLHLPGVTAGWVSDHTYSTVRQARDELVEASAASGVAIQKAYVIEYGNFAMLP
jgi:hypothetical protein